MITSPENPRIREVVRLRKGRERRAAGVFLAEGRREVERAFAAGLAVREVFVAPALLPGWTPDGDTTVTEVTPRVLAKLSYRDEPEGVLAVVDVPTRSIPEDATLILVAVAIEKPGNLGAMARSAAAAGADALLVADAECDPWNPNAIRASTGAVFTLPVLETTLDDVARLDVQRVAAVVDAGTSYTDADLTPPTALVVGAEDTGLDDRWRALADVEVSIPVRAAPIDSLNASAAAAVLLYESLRQRG